MMMLDFPNRAHDLNPIKHGYDSFRFTSGTKELSATGLGNPLLTPPGNGWDGSGPFQRAIVAALRAAKASGQSNPIVLGAIPFDTNEPACLYVPETYSWSDRARGDDETNLTQGQNGLGTLISQNSMPDEQGFKASVSQAIVNFQHSDVRKAVLSVQCELKFANDVNVNHLLDNLRSQNKDGYQFHVPLSDGEVLVGVSPELVIRKEGQKITTNPLAGSTRRHADPAQDVSNAERLLASEKDQFEHRLVIEDIVAHLHPLCSDIDVPHFPSLINTPTLWHLSTTIVGTLDDRNKSALQLACLLHPTPAVCGYPTERARKLIQFIEPVDRDFFTGMVGWSDSEGNGEWVVTIRCGSVKSNTIRLFAGAGIVEASSPDSEWKEVQTKLGTMLRACGIND